MNEYENNNDKENSKAKKIRRILLLQTDQELKKNSKRYSNIKINSKSIKQLNQAYNSYKILLSETSSIYSNYIQIFQKMYPDKSQIEKKIKEPPKTTRVEQNVASLNSSFESHSPQIEFIPNKIDLGEKKFSFRKKGSIKNQNSPKIFDKMDLKVSKSKECEDIKIKSTKLGNKGINKVIDKIVRIKLPTDTEDDDNIMKSVIKLRKYCFKLIKKRKKCKRQKPQLLSIKKTRGTDKTKTSKRKTIVFSNTLLKNNYLFGQKEPNQDYILTREDTYEQKPAMLLNSKLFDKSERQLSKNESANSNERKTYKLNSFKDLKTIRERVKEKINMNANVDKKRKLRRVQTLNIRNQPVNKLSHKKDLKKSDNAHKQINTIINGPVISTKFTRPSKFVIINNNINNNINNANIIFRKDINKKNSLFGVQRYDFKRLKTKKEKGKDLISSGRKNSLIKNGKRTIKLFNSVYHET